MRVLVLTHRLPYAPNRGDRIRAHHMLRTLAAHFEVELISLVHDAEEGAHARDLDRHGIRTQVAPISRLANLARGAMALPGRTPLTHYLLASGRMAPLVDDAVRNRRPDAVFAYCSSMARYALESPLAGLPLVLDMVDVDSEKWRSLAAGAGTLKRWVYAREHRTLSTFERQATETAATTLVVNERERDLLLGLAPGSRVRVVENGVDVEAFRPHGGADGAPVAVFCGVMSYEPNVAAARWLAHDVWPRVIARQPGARLFLVGASPSPEVQALASSSITVTGSVPATQPYLWQAAVGLAPLQVARGIQNKVLEAVAAGLPTVVTPVVAAGLPPEVAPAVVVAAEPEHFADSILELFGMTAGERRAKAGRARLDDLSWQSRLAELPAILEAAAGR